jgi:hypothetical protein
MGPDAAPSKPLVGAGPVLGVGPVGVSSPQLTNKKVIKANEEIFLIVSFNVFLLGNSI